MQVHRCCLAILIVPYLIVNVLRELCGDEDEKNLSQQQHKNMNSLKTELQIHIENQEIPGQVSSLPMPLLL